MSSARILTWESSPARELLRLAYPLALSFFSLSVMTLIDTLFIGRLGSVPLAAVGLGGPVVFTVASFGLAVFGAAKISVGNAHGRGHQERLEDLLGRFLRLAMALGGLTLTVGLAVSWGMVWLSPDPAVAESARGYVSVRSWGLPFALGAAALGQWRQGVGDSQSAMRAALAANLVNAPLNAWFLFGLGWGVEGAALATVLARLIELGWLTGIFGGALRSAWQHSRWRGALSSFLEVWPTGVERVLDMIAFSLVPVFLAQVGPLHVAGHQIVLQVMLMSFLPMFAVSESVSILISQALGAERPQLVSRLIRLGLRVAFAFAAVVAVVCLVFTEPLAGLFSRDPALVQLAAETIAVGALLQFINAGYNLLKGALRGLSDFRFVAWVTIGCAWIITAPLTWFLAVQQEWGLIGAWSTLCIEVSIGVVLLVGRLRRRLPRRSEQPAPVVA